MSFTNRDGPRARRADGRLWLVTSPLEPVRRSPSHESEMVTQVLGGQVVVGRERGDWLRAKVPDGSSGFIRSWGVCPVDSESPWLTRAGVFVRVPQASVRTGNGAAGSAVLPMGARCRVIRRAGARLSLVLPWGDVAEGRAAEFGNARAPVAAGGYGPCSAGAKGGAPRASLFRRATDRALTLVGAPYLWGGISSGGIDCSGLVWISAAAEGLLLPRDAKDQCAWLRKRIPREEASVAAVNRLRKGDLVFFGRTLAAVDHVGIVVTSRLFLHASRRVRLSSLQPGHELFEPRLRSLLKSVCKGSRA